MDERWLWNMFLATWLGSLFGLLWPFIVALWKKNSGGFYKWIDTSTSPTRYGGGPPVPPSMLRTIWFHFVVPYLVPPLIFVFLALLISCVTAALGFFAFLQDEKNREVLHKLGALAFFSAFSAGFATASFIEEPLKK